MMGLDRIPGYSHFGEAGQTGECSTLMKIFENRATGFPGSGHFTMTGAGGGLRRRLRSRPRTAPGTEPIA